MASHYSIRRFVYYIIREYIIDLKMIIRLHMWNLKHNTGYIQIQAPLKRLIMTHEMPRNNDLSFRVLHQINELH